MAASVLRAPSERMFGTAIVGRHHDPFTVMQQFERPIRVGMYSQPVTDITGALLSRVGWTSGGVQLADPPQFSVRGCHDLPACAPSRAVAGCCDRRGAGVRVLAVSSGARGVSSAHRTNAVAALVPARAVALPGCGDTSGGRISWHRDAGRDALELLRRIDRSCHHTRCRGRVLACHAAGEQAGNACTQRDGAHSRADRRMRAGVRVVRGAFCAGQSGRIRVSTIRSLALQREVVELSRSACRASTRWDRPRIACGVQPEFARGCSSNR